MKIVIRMPNWLGDFIMATAFVQAVERDFPNAQVDLIVPKSLTGLPIPHRGTLHIYDRKGKSPGSFGRDLRREKYDVFYVLPPSFSAAWMAYRSQAKRRIGYRLNLRSVLLNKGLDFPFPHRSHHIIDEYLQLLNPEYTHQQFRPILNVDSSWIEENWPKSLSHLPSFIGLAPGATYGPAKMWPSANYQSLADHFTRNGHPVVIMGTKAEQVMGEHLAKKNPRIINLAGQTSLKELVAVVAKASLVVSNDSGAMHVAAALKRPQIAIFGSTNPLWTGPINPLARIVYLNLLCSPCYKRDCPLGHTHCLNHISPDLVLEKAGELLGGGG